MTKLDKSKYTKEQFQKLLEQRRKDKSATVPTPAPIQASIHTTQDYAFVLGNGTSRKGIDPAELHKYGKIYGCNALYSEYDPDYLIAVDVKMILEIANSNYQNTHQVWTNPNKAYQKIDGLNYFRPSKGWSSGPTALHLATQHYYKKIFILGFDYAGLDNNQRVNNIYADTINYKKSNEAATYYGNWLKQTVTVIKENTNITFYRVIASDNFVPEQLNNLYNLKHITVDNFKKLFNLTQNF